MKSLALCVFIAVESVFKKKNIRSKSKKEEKAPSLPHLKCTFLVFIICSLYLTYPVFVCSSFS